MCGVSATTPQAGPLEQQTDPSVNGVSRVQQFVYDPAGREVGLRMGSTTTISTAGWQCSTYDPNSGRLTAQSWPATSTAPARTATYTYSVGGNPLVAAVTDKSGVTCTTPTTAGCVTATVDLLGRVIAYTDANGKTTTSSYAQDGQVQSSSGPQGTTTTGYDPNSGLPTTTALNGTTLATASYDTAGRMSSVSYANGTVASAGYDNYGNQTSLDYTTSASGALIDGQQTSKSPAGRITSTTFDQSSNYVPVTATRLADTRTGSGQPYAGQHLGAAATLNVQVTGANGDAIPASATAVVVSVAAFNATSPTQLTVYPAGSPLPSTTTLTVAGSGQPVDNQVTTPTGAGGQIAIHNSAGTVDTVVDVEGYYIPTGTGTAYQAVTPTRICNTRLSAPANQCNGNGTTAGTLQPGSTTAIQVTGNAGVPAGATAAVVDLGAASANPGGTFTTYADGSTRPPTANLTYSAAGAGPAASSWTTGREDLFVRGANNAIWHDFWNGATWSGWQSVGGTIASNPAAVSRTTNWIDLYGIGSNGQVQENSWNGTAWTGWISQGAPPPGIAAGSGPAVSSWVSNREDVFVRGADNAIWHDFWNGATWSGWQSLGGTIVSNPAAVSRTTNWIDLYGIGSNGQVEENSWNGTAWTGWISQGAPPPGIAPGSAVASWASTREDIFVRGADNAIWQKYWNGATWSAWASLGGALASNPAAISRTTNWIDVYATGTNGQIEESSWNGTAWTGWISQGAPSSGIAPDSLGAGAVKEAVVPLASNGRFDLYNASGTTDLTVDVQGYYSAAATSQYYPVTPTRVADTRTGSGQPLAGQTLGSNTSLTVPVVGVNNDQIPANANAVVVNLTTPDATANSTITAYPNGATQPATTTLTFGPGQLASNQATVAIGTNGAIALHNTSGNSDVTVDVDGYLAPPATTATATYTYDGAGRLTQTATPTNTTTYSYAATSGCPNNNAGANTNRTSTTITGAGAGTTSACYNNADQLTSTTLNGGNSNTNYTYDPGTSNQTLDNGTTLTWDSANRLATTTNPAGTVTTYTYDPLNRVTQQQDGTTTTRYSYGGMTTSAAAILDSNSNLVDSLIPLPGGVTVTVPAAGLTSSTWSYANLQGDTTLTATNTGTPQSNLVTYDPWGTPLPGSAPVVNTPAGSPTLAAYAAAGKLTDPNNNLITMGARPYNPTEARFLQPDPVNGGCANAYTYAFGDPLNQPDLTGRAASCRQTGWQLYEHVAFVGDAHLFVPTGLGVPSSYVALKITDLTGVSGEYTVSDQYGETKGYGAIWSPIPGIGHVTSGYMDFLPAFGQEGFDFDITYHPWSATAEGDTPDGTYVVSVYYATFQC